MNASPIRMLALSLGAVLAVLAGCDVFSSDKKDYPKVDTDIAAGETVEGALPKSGVREITFVADSGNTYIIRSQSDAGTLNLTIKYSDSTYSQTRESTSRSPDWEDSVVVAANKSGTYTIRIMGSGTTDYKIEMTRKDGYPSWYVVADGYEFDNTLRTAKTIPSDSTVQHRTLYTPNSSGYDYDWIAIKCDSGKTYTVHVEGIPGTSYFDIYNADSAFVSSLATSNYNSNTSEYMYTREFAVSKSGSYYVRLQYGYRNMSYSIAVTAVDGISENLVGDRFEIDNTLSAAKSIPTDSTVQSRSMHYDGKYDVDWIAIRCDSGKTYTVYQSGLGSSSFAIYKGDSTYVSTSYSSMSSAGSYVYYRSFGVAKSGTYYVRITSGSSTATKYTLAVTATNGISSTIVGDKFESDNTPSTAKTIPTDSTVQARTLHYDGSYDVDWIAIKCDSGKTYFVYQSGLGSSSFSIYKDDSTFLSTSYYNSSSPAGTNVYYRSFGVAKSGTYYVLVSYNSSSLLNYTLAVEASNGISSSLVGDMYEDDNTIAKAKTIATDSTVQSRSLHYDGSYDIDWVAIKCDSGKSYTVFENGLGSSYFAIYGPDSALISTTSTTGAYNSSTGYNTYSRKFGATRSGTYYVRLYSGSSAAPSYTLAVTTKAGLDITLVGDTYEPDNTIGTAKSIKTDSTVQYRSFHTTTSSSVDYDWISFKADSGHTYKFYSSFSGTPYFYGADSLVRQSSSIGSFYNSSTGSNYYKTVFPVTRSGTYYVRLYNSIAMEYWAAIVDSTGLPQWAKPDSGEPDHGLSSAMDTKADSSMLYRTINGNDTDWVRIPVQKDRVYSIRTYNDATSSSYSTLVANLLDSSNSTTSYATIYYTAFSTMTHVATKDGAIWIRLLPYSYSSSSAIPYRIQVSSTALPADILEPDQRLSTAAVVPTDSLPISRWVGYNDSDWMSFDVDSGRKVSVVLGIPSTSMTSTAVYCRLYSRDSLLIDYTSASSAGYKSQISYTPRYKGKLYLQVYNGYTSTITPYTIAIERYPIDSTEPDDGIATARSVPTDSSAITRILETTNADWVKFPVTAGRIYQFDLTGEYTTYMALFNEDSSTAAFVSGSYSSSTAPTFLEAKANKTMYLRLTNYNTSATNSIRLRISSFANDTDEPANGTTAGARNLGTDSVAGRGVLTGSDQDFYAVTLDSGTTYMFKYATTGNNSAYMALLTSESSSSYVFSSTTNTQGYTPTRTGKHYLRMTSYSSYTAAHYAVTVNKIANDSFEVDNAFKSAKGIEIGSPAQSRILAKDDVDWIAVPVDSGETYLLYVKSSDALSATVYTDDELVKYPATMVSGGIERIAQTLQIGRKCNLYVKLTPYYTTTLTNPYTVRVVKN